MMEKHDNVNEEVTVILNTFENGIVWVSKNDFKEMYLSAKQLPYTPVKRRRKYTVTDSLFSMNKFRSLYYEKQGKYIKKSIAFPFQLFKTTNIDGFEIINTSKKNAESDVNYNGNLTFSRVIFNKERNRAKYYFEQSILISKDRGWGMGTYIYAKKVKGIWVFEKEDEVWIT
ncbi:hypothetical protein [Pedobacter nototheniae]|uniref:hypothetical protein n=1 Tax=Pedobacter nototheniae TaxID=2488994 RepID=UPI00292F9C60|nr:hypothetical protein [Pedobacter nototheniae]